MIDVLRRPNRRIASMVVTRLRPRAVLP